MTLKLSIFRLHKTSISLTHYNRKTVGRKANERGVEGVEVLVVADSHGQEILEAFVCLQGFKEREYIKRSRRRL
jgi:hypothetical protein